MDTPQQLGNFRLLAPLPLGISTDLPRRGGGGRVWIFSGTAQSPSETSFTFNDLSNQNEHTIPGFLNLNILPVNFLYVESIASLMYDVQNNLAPDHIRQLFKHVSDIHSYNTKSVTTNKFYVMPSRVDQQKNSFSRLGVLKIAMSYLPASISYSYLRVVINTSVYFLLIKKILLLLL